MKTRIILMLIGFAVFTLTSCEEEFRPSGNIVQEIYHISDYNEIDISDAFEAYITFAPTSEEGIVIEADDNIQSKIEVKLSGDKLFIGVKNNFHSIGPVTLKAYISTSNEISGVYASGASMISFSDQLAGDNVTIDASGASRVFGEVDVNRLDSHLSGASIFELSGNADKVKSDLSGASTYGGYDLIVQDLETKLSGASNCKLTVNGTLDVEASGGSSVMYKGSGVISHQNLSGASQVIHLN